MAWYRDSRQSRRYSDWLSISQQRCPRPEQPPGLQSARFFSGWPDVREFRRKPSAQTDFQPGPDPL